MTLGLDGVKGKDRRVPKWTLQTCVDIKMLWMYHCIFTRNQLYDMLPTTRQANNINAHSVPRCDEVNGWDLNMDSRIGFYWLSNRWMGRWLATAYICRVQMLINVLLVFFLSNGFEIQRLAMCKQSMRNLYLNLVKSKINSFTVQYTQCYG